MARFETTTDIPAGVTTPDRIETRLGALEPWFDLTWRPSEVTTP